MDLEDLRESAKEMAGTPFKDEVIADYVSSLNDKDSEIKALEKEVEELEKEIEYMVSNADNSLDSSEGFVMGEDSEELEEVAEPEEEEEIDEPKEFAGNFEATAYTAFCNTGCTGVTATGYDVSNTIYKEGKRIIAADPSVIALGTNVVIKTSDGNSFEAVVEDTGGDIRGNRIDILVDSVDEAIEFGRQSVEVEIK